MPLECSKNEFDFSSDVDMSKHQLVKKRSSRITRLHTREKEVESSTNLKRETKLYLEEPEADYPPTTPPRTKKADVFKPEDFTEVETHVRKAPPEVAESYQALLDYLLKDLDSDLAKVRAVFYWIVQQKVPIFLCQKDIPSLDTPAGYLHLVRERKASYSAMFATLCRRAQVPCVVINGIAKSIAYDVGERLDSRKLKNSWNAVYVKGDWRFVHPHWAAMSAQGYSSGKWTVVECPDFHIAPADGSKSFIVHSMVNDFFFLTDPDKFITKCFPNDEKWQLLHTPISKAMFEESLFLQPTFYELGLSIPNQKCCTVQSENGKVIIEVEMPDESHDRLRFSYKFYRLRDSEDEGEYEYFHLDKFVLHHTKDATAFFEIRFPPIAVGHYKLELHCRDPNCRMISEWICDFRIICTSGMEVCEPLPVVPSIGWGAGPELRKHNIIAKTHKYGVYSIDDDVVTSLKFGVDDDTEIHAELVHNCLSKTELVAAVKQEPTNGEVVVNVKAPTEGEYALQIYSKIKGALHYENVCNYLLHRSTIVENPSMAEVRNRLTEATEQGDSVALAVALEAFVSKGLEDRGELKKAKRKFHLSRINKEIREALAAKDLEKLDRTMQNLSDTSLKRDLGSIVEDAEAMRSRLRKLKRLRKAVLDMDSKSISEIRSYPKPPTAVHGVMAATFLLLGNKEADLRKWSKVQGLISKKGKEGLKRRVAAFDATLIRPAVITRAKEILKKYDMESVQIASAGAATFYFWATNMIHDAEEHM